MDGWFDWHCLIDEYPSDSLATMNESKLQEAVDSASLVLHRLSGRVYGLARMTVLPFAEPWREVLSPYDQQILIRNPALRFSGQLSEQLLGGLLTWWAPGGAGGGWLRTARMDLGERIYKLHAVRINGAVVPAWANGSQVFLIPPAEWPVLEVPDAAKSSIDLTLGSPPPTDGVRAAKILAAELCKAFTGDSTCRLPARVQTLARQGVSFAVIDAQTFLDKGKTGIVDIDYFLSSANPGHVKQNPSVINVEERRACRRWLFLREEPV